jgi:hypothetical protein
MPIEQMPLWQMLFEQTSSEQVEKMSLEQKCL